MNYHEKYLDLLRDTLTFSLWPEPPRPVGITARRDIVAKCAKLVDRTLNRAGLSLCANKQIDREVGREWPLLAHTMVGKKRLDNIRKLCAEVCDHESPVPGSWVECGVWRGGASIYARACLPDDRTVYVCDSFQGLPFDPMEPEYSTFDFLRVSRKDVEANFNRFGQNRNVVFVEGWFADTLDSIPGPIAILRADGDMFSSTMTILGRLYDKVSPGGFVIIDDYGLPPCRQAIEVFREFDGITAPLETIDEFAVYWRKPFVKEAIAA